jgi:hypothetical protein
LDELAQGGVFIVGQQVDVSATEQDLFHSVDAWFDALRTCEQMLDNLDP